MILHVGAILPLYSLYYVSHCSSVIMSRVPSTVDEGVSPQTFQLPYFQIRLDSVH